MTPADVTVPRLPCVLLVEDNADTRELWQLVLREAGFEVRVAESVADALAALRKEEPFDVVVCDYWLPDGTGEQLLREATRWGLVRAGRVLLCTAHRSVAASSYAPVLHKPLLPDDLVARVRELLSTNPVTVAPCEGPDLLDERCDRDRDGSSG